MKDDTWHLFSCIKNGYLARRKWVIHRDVGRCRDFLDLFWDDGFISGYASVQDECYGLQQRLRIYLKYDTNGTPVMTDLKTICTPGNPISFSLKQIWKIDSSKVSVYLTTNKGVLTLLDCKKLGVGGKPFVAVT